MTNHNHYSYRILSEIDTGKPITQRSLSQELGVALGLTNLLIKRLVRKGFVKTSSAIKGRRLKYLLTPEGIAEKSRLSIAYLENTIRLYTETREKIRESLSRIVRSDVENGNRRPTKILFYGAGEVAEIAYITLNSIGLELVGVVDDHKSGQNFFSHVIRSPEQLADQEKSASYDRIIVTTFRKSGDIRQRLEELRIPSHKIFFL